MKKEEFMKLGLDEENAKKCEAASVEELKGFIPKERFDEVNGTKKTLETTVADYKSQLETLKQTSGDAEELKKQIETLQTDNKKKDEQYQTDLKEIRLTNAIKSAVGVAAHDGDLVAGMFDRSKLILGDDGKVTGLEEQLKGLKETKGFLFKEENKEPTKPQPGIRVGGGTEPTGTPETKMSFKDAIAAKLSETKQ